MLAVLGNADTPVRYVHTALSGIGIFLGHRSIGEVEIRAFVLDGGQVGDSVDHECQTAVLELIDHILFFHGFHAVREIAVLLQGLEVIRNLCEQLVVGKRRLAVLHQGAA